MNKKYLMVVLGFTMIGAGCSSAPKSVVDMSKVGEEEVIQTYGKHDELKKSEPFKVEDHMVIATALATVPADSGRQEAAIKIAQASARAEVAKATENRLENYLQVASENASMDTQELREMITEASKITANGLKLGRTYVEKVKVYNDSGLPRTEYRAWAEVKIDENQFKRLVVDSLRRQEGKMGMSAEFHKSVSDHWQKMLSSEESKSADAQAKPTEERKPASDVKVEKPAEAKSN